MAERNKNSKRKPSFNERPEAGSFKQRPNRRGRNHERSFQDEENRGNRSYKSYGRDKRRTPNQGDEQKSNGDRPYRREYATSHGEKSGYKTKKLRPRKKNTGTSYPERTRVETDELVRLNRYIANSGICSRRKADELISAGVVSVNGEVVSTLGTKVNPLKDEIRYNGERIKREQMVYILLNKPKDYITTTDDPQERRTVMHLVEKASRERIYPIGRLDRNTTGLLLMTNDGDLAEKLSHPRNKVTKIYQVELDKNLTQGDFNKIAFGLELEDGFIKPDALSYVQGASKREIGIQIHSGKNRIVRRIFESLGYNVIKLDRSIYANLTKKDLPRGRWRRLEEQEIIQLKHLIQTR